MTWTTRYALRNMMGGSPVENEEPQNKFQITSKFLSLNSSTKGPQGTVLVKRIQHNGIKAKNPGKLET
jgi:hypothetical protein